MKERIGRHRDGTSKAKGRTVDECPTRSIARRCVKTTVTSKISVGGDISIPGATFMAVAS